MSIECYDSTCQYHGEEGPFCDEDECRKKVGAAIHEKEFEEFFESGKLLLRMILVPPRTDVESLIKGWMKEAYIAGVERGLQICSGKRKQ